MSNLRKLSNFRQLSLSCETPTQEKRRKSLKKQFSEDLPDLKDNWLDPSVCIKIAMNSKGRRSLDRPPPVKIAWEENTKNFKTEEAVIIKKCSELKRPVSKLVRHSSLENDSILYTKPKLVDMLQNPEQDNEKPNLNIFLAYNAQEANSHETEKSRPKIMEPLFPTDAKNILQIRKAKPKINLSEIAYSPTRTNVKPKLKKEETIVESNLTETNTVEEIKSTISVELETLEPKAINNVIIRPITAASRREKFQKRTNSAFTSIAKESTAPSRPPLIRTSSAPCKSDQSKSKFLATKRKLKSAKRTQFKPPLILDEDFSQDNKDSKSQKALNRSVSINGSDIVTMVSLVSPDGSDVEDNVEEGKEKTKPIISPNRNAKENDLPKNSSLRKTVKSVSFQQSSIHSIRSFSASFPARRGSVATSLFLNPGKVVQNSQKVHEKRATNSTTPDDDEQVPKRRLVRSQSVKSEPMHDISADIELGNPKSPFEVINNPDISVNVKAKESNSEETEISEDSGISEDLKLNESPENDKSKEESEKEEEKNDGEPKFESAKEKQCWDMFCKMSGKGINVSYDTILRGMLTPTEYRMSRKTSIAASFEKDTEPEQIQNNN